MKLTVSKSILTLVSGVVLASTMTWSKPSFACSPSGEGMLGSVCIFGGNFVPRGYAMAKGDLIAISSNTALFSLLGTIYGGDGRTTFALPDLRGRAAIGFGQGPGLSPYAIGAKGGLETVTLTALQMPTHSHTATSTATTTAATLNAATDAVTSADPTGHSLTNTGRTSFYSATAPSVAMHAGSVSVTTEVSTIIENAGGNQAHENRMPYLAMNYIIALQGVFPSRQ